MTLLVFAGCFFLSIMIIGFLLSSRPYRGNVTGHFDGRHFFNPEKSRMPGPRDMFRFMTGGPKEKWRKPAGEELQNPGFELENDYIRYLGHATFLIRLNGNHILLDPVFRSAGPLGFFGPPRFRKPGVALAELPAIDCILVSHNHYDHFDVSAVKYLIRRDNPRILMPLGCGNALPGKCRSGLRELDWWEKDVLTGFSVAAVPARHFSGRGMFDRNRSLWCGFIIQTEKLNIYFAGDTANGAHFSEIGKNFPSPDFALLPIGAYRPERMMKDIHINPEEAVIAFQDIDAKRMIAYHHRTFRLAWEGPDTPERELYTASEKNEIDRTRILAPKEGEVISVEQAF